MRPARPREVILGEIVIYEIAVALVDDSLLGQRGADAERHPADRLRPRGLGVEGRRGVSTLG